MLNQDDYGRFRGSRFHYYGSNYEFTLTDEKFQQYTSLIIAPKHIKILINKTELSARDLKSMIVESWFAEENDIVRNSNNAKRRSSTSLKLNQMRKTND